MREARMRPRGVSDGVSGRLAASLCCALLMLGGCSCGGRVDAEELLREAMARSGEAATLRADLSASIEPEKGSGALPVSLQGVLDMDREARALRLSFSSFMLEGELVFTGGKLFLKMGGTWYHLPEGPGSGGVFDLVSSVSGAVFSYPDLVSAYASAEKVGEQKVAGRDCHHLEVSPDLRAIAELRPVKEMGERLGLPDEALLQELQGMAPALEVWVDRGDGFVRKLELALEVDFSRGMAFLGILRGSAVVRISAFFDGYGLPLDIEPPQQSEPLDLEDIPFL